MNYTPLIQLNSQFRLSFDDLQWIIQRYDGSKWRGIAFVCGKKVILVRNLDEEGITLTEIANVALKSLPDTFKEWRNTLRRVQTEKIIEVSVAAE